MTTKKQPNAHVEGATGKEPSGPNSGKIQQEGGTAAASTPAPGGSKSGVLKDKP